MSPSEDELAAIAAAYAIVFARRDAVAERHEPSRWALAGRVQIDAPEDARFAARAASRWSIAGRLDG